MMGRRSFGDGGAPKGACAMYISPWLRSSERRVEFPVKEARAQ